MPKGFKKDGSKLGFKKGHIINNNRVSPFKGKHHTEEYKRKKSEQMKGKIPKCVLDGSMYSSKQRSEKLSKARKGKTWEEIYGVEQAKLLRKNLSNKIKNLKPNQKGYNMWGLIK